MKSSFALQVGNIFNSAHLLFNRRRPLKPHNLIKDQKKVKNTGNKGKPFLCTDNWIMAW